MIGDTYERYKRQIILRDWGLVAQEKLMKARILIIGAGGLGCPAIQYLAAAGVGRIGIIDYDVVELSNLHRQTLFNTEEIGLSKAECAAKKIRALNPGILVKTYTCRLIAANALQIFSDYDLVIDGSDNFATRYLVNDACTLLQLPLIYGAVYAYEGQLSVFNYAQDSLQPLVNYRDLFPVPPHPADAPSCVESGVLGVLPGIIGTMQAAEAIKVITGIGQVLSPILLTYNLLTNNFYEIHISSHPNRNIYCPLNKGDFIAFDYEWFCQSKHVGLEISPDKLRNLLNRGNVTVIDIREENETPTPIDLATLQIPESSFQAELLPDRNNDILVIICQTGKRSLKLCRLLKNKLTVREIYSLSGGVLGWNKSHLTANT